jgi:hypothetical protein
MKQTVLAATGLVVLVVALYAPVLDHEFLSYDDDTYVTGNPFVRQGLSAESARWALTATHASNWHPLTWLTHMLDVELHGLDPAGHHRTNVLLHGLNAALLLAALYMMTGRLGPSFAVALLFAVHPLRVESVAWVAERKDVLSGSFWMLTAGVRHLRARSSIQTDAGDAALRPVAARCVAVGASALRTADPGEAAAVASGCRFGRGHRRGTGGRRCDARVGELAARGPRE